MGAWGTGNFENDSALDFVGTVLEGEKWETVLEQLRQVDEVPEAESIDAGLAENALAAAEFVASCLKSPSPGMPDEAIAQIRTWQWTPDSDAVALTTRAVLRIASDSELSDLWSESDDDFEQWAGCVDGLLKRLGHSGL